MVNELRQLMREATEQAPDDLSSLDAVVAGGRRRVRRRRLGFAGTTVGGVAVVAAAFALTVPHGTGGADTAGDVPMPDAPTLRLSAAVAASQPASRHASPTSDRSAHVPRAADFVRIEAE